MPEGNGNTRFYDSREKYRLYATTTNEKWAIAQRIGRELASLEPVPPAIRVFDAGMGDATVLSLVMRQLHQRMPTVPQLVVAKEISLEDVRIGLEHLADRFVEHPMTVLVLTNMYFRDAVRLTPRQNPERLKLFDVALHGSSGHAFDEQIRALAPVLADGWRVEVDAATGNPHPAQPFVLVVYRADHRFVLDRAIPRRGEPLDGHDLIIASQPYRARTTAERKVRLVLAPLAQALAPGGRMVTVQSYGHDAGMELVRALWPDEDPFQTPRNVLIDELRRALADDEGLKPEAGTDNDAIFRYEMHALSSELSASIGTSSVLAAFNAACYVAQIDEARFRHAISSDDYFDATCAVLQRHGGLWFNDESFVIRRRAR
ncbi:MAG: hypothetical protein R3F55_15165 [Alphaproteobacteria bacterium]